jgi:hypothetical protein
MLAARSNQSNWAGTINIGSKESKTNSPLLYAYVTFPNDERLIGKSLQLRINMNVRYPKLMSNSQYQDVMENYQYNTTVTLSKKAVGANYRVAWCYGMLGGLTLAVAGGLVLPFASRAFARRANPTQIFTPEQPAEMDAVEEVTENGLERTEGIQPAKRNKNHDRGFSNDGVYLLARIVARRAVVCLVSLRCPLAEGLAGPGSWRVGGCCVSRNHGRSGVVADLPRALGPIANFDWQLMAVAALIASALMCGWLQGKLQWTPGEVCFVPSANEARHGEHH